jgi:hypothetical protein
MEPITVATAFASIVGLIRMYKAEVQEHDGRVFNGYIEWLRRQEHTQLVDLILGNDVLTQSVRDLIEDQHGEVMAKLESLDKIITGVARHIGTFQSLANVIRGAQLSGQAVSVLHQLNHANSSGFVEIRWDGGGEYDMLDTNGQIQISEPRFIDDDLLTLCELDLLRLSYNASGDRIFTITRAGAAVGG